jgi:hypothetical protein
VPKQTTIGPLGIEHANPAGGWDSSGHIGFAERNELLRIISGAFEAIDQFVGQVTGSAYFTAFILNTGSAADLQTSVGAGFVGAEYNRSQDRIITEVVAWAQNSGSGGVSTVDVLVQQGQVFPANFGSIFTNNALRPAVSSSLGNFGISKSSTFVSGSNMVWKAGTLLQAKLLTAAVGTGVNAQNGLTVQVYWKPSSSWAV